MNEHLNVNTDLGRAEMVKLAKARPFHKFVTFPIKVQIAEEVLKSNGTYCLPEDGDYTEKVLVGKTIRLPDGLKSFEWKVADFSPGSIGTKPEPLKMYVEKAKMEGKEKYLSPFSGKWV